MLESYGFFKLVLDSITEHIVVINRAGNILYQNRAWTDFGKENNCLIRDDWHAVNYLEVCDASAAMGDAFGLQASTGIRRVINNELEMFEFEYPCHSQEEKRWFMMRVTRLSDEMEGYYVISHQNITERKLAEEHALSLSRIDGLTNIPNRRYFDEFLDSEWRRCDRLGMSISLAILDVDHFKLLNDHYGHQAGDECLVKIGEVINELGKRPGDLFARYGGEEFALIFGNTTTTQAMVVVDELREAIEKLAIPNAESGVAPHVTVSVGVATMTPDKSCSEEDLVKAADDSLYTAKEAGRNRVVVHENSRAAGLTMAGADTACLDGG